MATFVYVLKYKYQDSEYTSNIGAYSTLQKAAEDADRMCKDMPRAWQRNKFDIEALTLE